MDLHGDALNKIVGDMDDMESKKMMPGGATITITVSPGGEGGESGESGEGSEGDFPPGHDISMCKGGCAYHQGGEVASSSEELPADMAVGGMVPQAAVPGEVDDMRLPPFLRKKKVV